jgi:pseudouridylate synthase
MPIHSDFLPVIHPEVRAALSAGQAVVALESTIITHGMPFPDNVANALELEQIVRDGGAVPATIALIDGVAHVGLDRSMLERLGNDNRVQKASSRDLAAILCAGRSAGTTVSATMRLAEIAGIAIFATGGIGGVHRGAELTFDVSADLTELGRTPTAVVCAGCKSILDIPKTLEVLETQRVPVIGFRTDHFPAFYAPSSGIMLDHRVETPEAAAALIAMHRRLGIGTGLVLANPIPADAALDPEFIDTVIDQALLEATAHNIRGKAITPFLLAKLNQLSQGRSLVANRALVRANAALGAHIAVALAALL